MTADSKKISPALLCWDTHCRWIHVPDALPGIQLYGRNSAAGRERRKALLFRVPHRKKIYQNLFARIVIVSPPVAMIIKLHRHLSWLGPAAGVQGWHWPQSEVVALERGNRSFAASVTLVPQCAFLHPHHTSSSLLLSERLGSTSGQAPSSTGARGQKILLPGAGEDSSSRGGKALAIWILGLLGEAFLGLLGE